MVMLLEAGQFHLIADCTFALEERTVYRKIGSKESVAPSELRTFKAEA
jgi:hypothetical protein